MSEFGFDLGKMEIDCNMLGIGEVEKKAKEKTSDKYKKQAKLFLTENKVFNTENIKKRTYRYIYDKNLIPVPEKGEQIRIRTQQQMNLITIILKVIDIYSEIEELTISTYTINREAMSILTQLKDGGKIKRVNLLISSSYGFRDPKWYEEIKALCIGHKMHLTFAWAHFKITLIEAKGNYFQIEGSMNYSTNNMAEQLLLENSETTYMKDYEFINSIMTDRKNKALEIIC
ncbi:MAG TPA: hypothetical protein VMW50_00175 [Dehalococcoidia bacterium]|nr:hypothetical protein [Dehalococcoidia bacterium]